MTTLSVNSEKPVYRVPIQDKARLAIQNFRCLPNRIALWWLGRQFRKDADYRESWKANIAMPIYDATRMRCMCNSQEGHEAWCPIVRAHDIRAFECGEMNAKHANYIADILLKHLFKA